MHAGRRETAKNKEAKPKVPKAKVHTKEDKSPRDWAKEEGADEDQESLTLRAGKETKVTTKDHRREKESLAKADFRDSMTLMSLEEKAKAKAVRKEKDIRASKEARSGNNKWNRFWYRPPHRPAASRPT